MVNTEIKLIIFLPGYEQETGTVGELMELKYPPNPKAYSAPMATF